MKDFQNSSNIVTPESDLAPSYNSQTGIAQPKIISNAKQSKSNSVIDDASALQQQTQENQNLNLNGNSINGMYIQNNSLPSPKQIDGNITRIYDNDQNVFTMNQVIAQSGEMQRLNQRGSKQRKFPPQDQKSIGHTRVSSNPKQAEAPQVQYQVIQQPQQNEHFQVYNMFHPTQPYPQQFAQTQQPMIQQPQQVHFIAKQQKFYQISPQRGSEMAQAIQVGQVPILLDKRPYTSSSIQQIMGKRQSGNKVQNSAIAALYLPNAKVQTNNQNSKQTSSDLFASQSSQIQSTPYNPPKKRIVHNHSVPRKPIAPSQAIFTQLDHEQLFEESIKLKQNAQELREENSRLKTRLKMQETDIIRKDKAIEDFYQQNQFIQNAQKTASVIGAQLAPIAATTQKYQQETFLLMSLKKQVKQLKSELQKRDDQLAQLIKISKISKYQEQEQELDVYKEEIARLQTIIESRQADNLDTSNITQFQSDLQITDNTQTKTQLSVSESNQAHVIHQGKQNQISVEMIHQESQLIEVINSKDAQIAELTIQLQNQSKQLQQSQEGQQKFEVNKLKKQLKDALDKINDKDKQIKQNLQDQDKLEQKHKDYENQIKSLQQKALTQKDALKSKDEKINEKENTIQQLEKKNKLLKETISKVQAPKKDKEVKSLTNEIQNELNFVAPILGTNQRISDRLTLASELKQGFTIYTPTPNVQQYLKATSVQDIAVNLPSLQLHKAKLDQFIGDIGPKQICDFSNEKLTSQGKPLTKSQKQFLMARYLVEIQGSTVYINSQDLQKDIEFGGKQQEQRVGVDEEQMLDIAELCFVKIAEVLIKDGITVREVFSKYAMHEMLPETKAIIELLIPEAFFEALKAELKLGEFTDLEVACLMRVLAKPELDNAIILNEFALIMENFGVPLIDGTISEDEDYIPQGQDKPRVYELKNIDDEGIQILQDVARHLLKEYLHPREFFGKMIKQNQEFKSKDKVHHIDILAIKDFYLKIKIASIRKTLTENQSLNNELCLDPVAHPKVFNMKIFVRALEDLAEIEQDKLFKQEKLEKEMIVAESIDVKPDKQQLSSALAPTEGKKSEYRDQVEVQKEAVRFVKGSSKSRRSPKPHSKFQVLGTIDEAINETATSHQQSQYDVESKIGSSNQQRGSNQIDFEESNSSHHKESMNRIDLLNRSLSGRGTNPELIKSLRSDEPLQSEGITHSPNNTRPQKQNNDQSDEDDYDEQFQ